MSPETKSDMEHDLSSAVHMVHIALTMLEKALGEQGGSRERHRATGYLSCECGGRGCLAARSL